ncbi:hypothetical protein [uncultured Thalassolituus sp.]|uniref:hypothetical protein n=1 Tax=uncultured Thalassolituus sp. TaxID=285273 RepID=UPI00262A1EBC|nr:hypothetical protein [uncultured Thalassolituus sp.]
MTSSLRFVGAFIVLLLLSASLLVNAGLPEWQSYSAVFEREWQQLTRVGGDFIAAWDKLFSGMSAGERVSVLMNTGLPLLLILPLRWLAKWFADRLARALGELHNRLVSGSIKHKGLRAVTRFITSITPLVPWIILLWVAMLVPSPDRDINGPGGALPLLFSVYVVYVLVNLSLEWFLLSTCQGAGQYLNAENTALLEKRSHRVTSWLLFPWVVIALSEYLLKSAVISQLIGALVWVFSWLVISFLLRFYRESLVTNLKRLTPERFDPMLEPMASGKLSVLILPLLIPLNLVLFLQAFVDQLLGEFPWYQRLSARWFRMKKQALESEPGDDPNERTDENYLRWFQSYGEENFPIISTGLGPAISKYFEAWHSDIDDDNVLLIAGEPGIGKKSAVRRFCKEAEEKHEGLKIRKMDIPARTLDPAVLHSLIGAELGVDLSGGPAALASASDNIEPTLLVINNAENLFLADVGCLDAWRALLSLTNARAPNVFWLIVINNQSWAYLCNVFGRDYQMRNVIRVKRWTQAEIRSLILSRNQQSGYRLKYDDVLVDTRAPANNTLKNAEQRYFSLLWDASRGVPVTALTLWRASVVTRRGEVTVKIPRMPSGVRIEKSGSHQLFVFAAIVTHGSLAAAELVRVTNIPENVVRFALKAALEDEVIEKGDDGRYRITTLWYHTVVNILNRMNMLHE